MTVDWHRAIRQLEQLKVAIPNPFDVGSFTQTVAKSRGRPIQVVNVDTDRTHSDLHAFWWAAPDVDYIIPNTSAPALVREHGTLHTLSHMLLGHVGSSLAETIAAQFRFVDALSVLRRSGHDTRTTRPPTQQTEGRCFEIDAEAVASLIAVLPDAFPSKVPQQYSFAAARLPAASPEPRTDTDNLYKTIWPLWRSVVHDLSMPRLESIPPQPHPTLRRIHLFRMTVEITEGLHHLRRLLDPYIAETARKGARNAGLPPGRSSVVAEAACIAVAIDRAAAIHTGDSSLPSRLNELPTGRTVTWPIKLYSKHASNGTRWLADIAQTVRTSSIVHEVRRGNSPASHIARFRRFGIENFNEQAVKAPHPPRTRWAHSC